MLSLLIKVWYDLWSNRARTIQVVLVIALGAFGIGLVIGGRNLIVDTIADQWKLAEPPNIKLGVTPSLTDEQLRKIERIEGVYQVEGLLSGSVEYRLPGESEWQTALLWLVIITVLAVIASSFPARSAAKVSVRKSLTY